MTRALRGVADTVTGVALGLGIAILAIISLGDLISEIYSEMLRKIEGKP